MSHADCLPRKAGNQRNTSRSQGVKNRGNARTTTQIGTLTPYGGVDHRGGTAFWSVQDRGEKRGWVSPHTLLLQPPAGGVIVFGGQVNSRVLTFFKYLHTDCELSWIVLGMNILANGARRLFDCGDCCLF
jgi:hypothetical protein